MNLVQLLSLLPLIFAAFLVYHLVFSQKLPAQGIGKILTYMLGFIIVAFAVSWIIIRFLPGWANNLLSAGQEPEWQQFITNSENIVGGALGTDTSTNTVPVNVVPNQNVPVIVVTATPMPGTAANIIGAPVQYTVVAGDTLTSIAQRFGTTVNDLRFANSLQSDLIKVGQVLIIPAGGGGD